MPLEVVPSLLCKTREELIQTIKTVELLCKRVHIDIADGVFVQNTTIALDDLSGIQTKKRIELHLMVRRPHEYIQRIALLKKKPWCVIIHSESCSQSEAELLFKKLRELNIKIGIACLIKTPISLILSLAKEADVVVIMTVKAGFGGQEMHEEALKKVARLRELFPNKDIEIDGGVNTQTIRLCQDAGASTVVVGSTIFQAKSAAVALQHLREVVLQRG